MNCWKILLVMWLMMPSTITAQSISQRIDSLMQVKHQSGEFNGTVLVAVEGTTIYQQALGVAENKRPLEAGTQFYLGSLSKAFTGMAVMMLAEEGMLTFNDQVHDHLPALPPLTRDITIRNLLNHTSGLPDYYDRGAYVDGMTNEMVLKFVSDLDSLEFTPGVQYSYSNTGYVLLSLLIERISGKTFREFVTDRIFDPIGMEHSEVVDGTQPAMPLRARGHSEAGKSDDYKALTTGAGGIYSQVEDLLLWDQALYQHQLVKKKTLVQAFEPARLNDGILSYYGFGWRLKQDNPQVVQHSGSLAGFRTYLYRNTKKRNTVILLSNFTNDVGSIKEEIVKIIGE